MRCIHGMSETNERPYRLVGMSSAWHDSGHGPRYHNIIQYGCIVFRLGDGVMSSPGEMTMMTGHRTDSRHPGCWVDESWHQPHEIQERERLKKFSKLITIWVHWAGDITISLSPHFPLPLQLTPAVMVFMSPSPTWPCRKCRCLSLSTTG